jgi:hypothetical protein
MTEYRLTVSLDRLDTVGSEPVQTSIVKVSDLRSTEPEVVASVLRAAGDYLDVDADTIYDPVDGDRILGALWGLYWALFHEPETIKVMGDGAVREFGRVQSFLKPTEADGA